MARRHPAIERFRGSATGSRRSPGLRFEMDMRLANGLEREGTVQDFVPDIGTIRGQGARRTFHLPGRAEAGEAVGIVPHLIEARLEAGALPQPNQRPLPMLGDAESP